MAAVLAALVATCGGSSTSGTGPDAVVSEALAKLQAKDLEGMSTLACAGQEDRIREQLGGTDALGAALPPGLDPQALLDAVEMDVSKVEVGDPTVSGDAADVPVTGTIGIAFDKEAMRPVLRQILEQQGQSMTDEQLDAMLEMLGSYAQDLPFDESVHLVRENGAWRICDAG